jgi:2-polyprenyl-3-methyl-5-hydroxy-6-metoxy-1,4-benzoquinol methylase
MSKQELFKTCYRGRQSRLHHLSYMRTSKVFLALRLLKETEISLEGKAVFDYGFGAGTFFLHCPRSAKLGGCEIEPSTVREVEENLRRHGYERISLKTIDLNRIEESLQGHREYDLCLCSHVLEHVPDPPALIRQLSSILKPGGHLIFLVPINERYPDAHHEHTVDLNLVKTWITQTGLECQALVEADPWIYPFQTFFVAEHGWKHPDRPMSQPRHRRPRRAGGTGPLGGIFGFPPKNARVQTGAVRFCAPESARYPFS